ncbi:NADP-dependent oxidoreductase domain-containing protein [Radiomyces spectabilis]|uniref:NADP-dependent oxidoreductase domain-containing protein n=1 Tax=Radiomyces spectabilis TaxID=64574 RepID=UPI00221E463F|nr:NADP-dependent oxidoreductase domain-containing protein [Radiomyces spectabilis]KAI8377979.1 NADP-dependent oxidoreductase domain-containing protein [Radiomyces spectabilis]
MVLLAPQHQGYEACYQAVNDSLKRFNLDYFDLYLIHWPGTSKTKLQDPVNQENRMGSYGALEQLYKESKLRQIGVSNYTAKHLQHLLSHCSIRPHVHQFELHPCLYQPEVLSLCRENSIQIQAYSSLGEGRLIQDIEIPALTEIANNLGVTKAQVLLRWAIQHDYAVIPKSKTPERVKSNADLFSFELSDQQLAFLDNVHQTISHRFCWDPTDIY